MNKAEEAKKLQNRISDIIYANATCIDFADPQKVWQDIGKEIQDSLQQYDEQCREEAIEFHKWFAVTRSAWNESKKRMQQYAEQESRENEEWTAIEFATTHYTLGIPRETVIEDFNKWYPERKAMVDLKELEKRLNEALARETKDSLNSWLDGQRINESNQEEQP